MKIKHGILSAIPLLLAGIVFTSVKKPEDKTSINYKQSDLLKRVAGFPIGVAVDPYSLVKDPKYKNLVLTEFNSLTTENALKWHHVSVSPTVFNFSESDTIVNFALRNSMRVHGHALIYFEGTPAWLQNFQGDSLAWENLFKTHIQTLVSHFKGKIISWDVVNENFDQDGNVRLDAENKKFINVWAKHLGKDYVARAFQYAHAADPKAILFYNDYDQEKSDKKLHAIINMVNDFKGRGIPIGGLGLQMHTNINVSETGIRNAFTKFAKTGLKIHISELDIRLNPHDDINTDSDKNSVIQANLFRFIAHEYKADVPKGQQYGITFWDLTDKDSWVKKSLNKKDAPLLFNESYNRKKSYQSFLMGLKQ
jgi:endo-1,4-beta-xylanase